MNGVILCTPPSKVCVSGAAVAAKRLQDQIAHDCSRYVQVQPYRYFVNSRTLMGCHSLSCHGLRAPARVTSPGEVYFLCYADVHKFDDVAG